jgi:hypothetical protein
MCSNFVELIIRSRGQIAKYPKKYAYMAVLVVSDYEGGVYGGLLLNFVSLSFHVSIWIIAYLIMLKPDR